VTSHETSVLSTRLQLLADDLTPQLDVVAQVRAARERNGRQRRGRIAFLSVAAATAAVVVGTTTAADLLSASADREVAGPALPTVPTTEPAPVTEPAPTTSVPATPTTEAEIPVAPSDGSTAFPDGWEDRSFMGVTFMVPPGARTADSVEEVPVSGWMQGPTLTWNGPLLSDDTFMDVRAMIRATYEGGLPPTDGVFWITIPGADQAYAWIEQGPGKTSGATGPARTEAGVQILDGDRRVVVDATFPPGVEGEQMARTLFDSIVIG
jgi:hypothetical protein